MAQPVPYIPVTSFIGYQASQPWFPGQNIDIELAALKATTDQVRANLALIQRDDGALTNGSVGWLQLDAATQLAFTTGLATAGASVAMTDGQMFIGQTGANPLAKTVTGDATIAKTGVLTIAANAVTNAKAAQMAAATIKGNNTTGTANSVDLTAVQAAATIGAWGNNRVAKTVSYAVLNADKGQTFALSAGGQTLTLGAASGFDANFIITAVNESATRAWNIAPNGLTAFFLYPGQSALIFNQNNVWQVIREKRWQLTGGLTVYVDGTLGSDTNDGLAVGTGGAFATIQKGVNFCRDAIDACFRPVIVQVADGTYTQAVSLYDVVGVDNGAWNPPTMVLRGNVAALGNVTLNVTAGSGNCITAVNVHTSWYVDGFLFTTSASGNSHVVADYGATIYVGTNKFGACVAHQIQAVNAGSRVELVANYTISGNAGGYHWSATWGGEIVASTITVTLTGTPSFVAFANGSAGGNFLVSGVSFSGSGTGARIAFDQTVTCSVSPATFPGNVAGTIAPITNSLGADVALNNTGTYFDGPSVAQGLSGTWFASGTVTLTDTGGAGTFSCKLWDGTTVIASCVVGAYGGASVFYTTSLSGMIATPAGNLRISVKDTTGTTGKILFNQSGNSKDSTVTAIRVG